MTVQVLWILGVVEGVLQFGIYLCRVQGHAGFRKCVHMTCEPVIRMSKFYITSKFSNNDHRMSFCHNPGNA